MSNRDVKMAETPNAADPSSSALPTTAAPADLTVTQYAPIIDSQADIATTNDKDKMKVDLAGRQPMQKCYLWLGSNETSKGKKKTSSSQTTNKPYKPDEDGPKVAGLPQALPTREELIPDDHAAEYLEVGLVMGDDPAQRKVLHKAGNKKGPRSGGTASLDRDPHALRVFIPITPHVAEQAKYYVACKQISGRCHPRVVEGDCVFFYAEFWQGVPENANKKERREFVNGRTKYHAATNKTAIDRSTAPIAFTDIEKWTSSNPLAVTSAENLASTLVLQLSMYLETENRDWLQSMLTTMETAAPDLKLSPYTMNSGVAAFYYYEEELSEEDATNLQRELKAAFPEFPDLRVALIQTLHRTLRENELSEELPYANLAFFLEYCNDAVPEGSDKEFVAREVRRALQAVKLHNKYQQPRSMSPGESISKDDYHMVLDAVQGVIQGVCAYIDEANKALAQQHGGILRHGGIKDLMNKLGNALDVASQQSFWEQLSVLHAVQHGSINRKAAEKLEELLTMIKAVLQGRGTAA